MCGVVDFFQEECHKMLNQACLWRNSRLSRGIDDYCQRSMTPHPAERTRDSSIAGLIFRTQS
eukprot:1603690-Amphidinium_carterae.1